MCASSATRRRHPEQNTMADQWFDVIFRFYLTATILFVSFFIESSRGDILGCGGFLKSKVPIDFSRVEIKLYTKQGTLKESSDCAPTNGYYFIPLYDKGEYWLKIEPPAGWYFEPKEVHLNFDGENDPCSKSNDINFVFEGFTIHGKVVSINGAEGPENLVVNLMSKADKTLKLSTLTGKNGYFQFTPIVPENYLISVKHEKYKFLKDSVSITVKEENLQVPDKSLVIAGYDITGQVLFNGEPTKGVTFILSSNDKVKENHNFQLIECSKAGLPNFTLEGYICHVSSDEKGIFQMKTLPPGNYKIRPHYTKFDVQPEEMNVVVKYSHVNLSETFLVKGFGVSGRVLTEPGGKGIAGAQIFLNGQRVAIADFDGRYTLDSMEPGTYVLSVHSDDLKFEEVKVKVSPNTPEIENIFPVEFKVSGSVIPNSGQHPRVVEIRENKQASKRTEILVNSDTGKFFVFLRPGNYVFSVKVSDLEKSTGMQYLPLAKDVKVINGPVKDLKFTQLRGNIRGKVVKLEESAKAVELSVKLKLKNSVAALKILEGSDLSYHFEEVMPGFYDVELENDLWCFRNQVHSISVTSAETTVPDFVQTGFKIKISSSHRTAATISTVGTEKRFEKEILLEKGENAICLPSPVSYRLEPKGCHGYDKNFFLIDARNGGGLRLEAISHDVTGRITSPHSVNDLVVEVKLPDGSTKKLGPLRGEQEGTGFVYKFVYRTKENNILKFTPVSSKLLLQPEFMELRTVNDCWDDAIRFAGEKGLMVEGSVNPPLSDVKISLKTVGSDREQFVLTKADGKYAFGPLRSTSNFEIKAEKESYILSGPDKNGVFHAHKLAEIHVKVLDNSTKEPLQGVLLSLTGGEKYRKNSMTTEGGLLTFHSLSPGEYFLRPMMKEYKFEPSSQIIQIKEGVTESIELRGRRVSFSAYGLVTSLNGEPEPDVVIEAAGINTCSNLQEEASSETNGQFRIRGLLPQCEYQIRLKSGPDVNVRVHRLSPEGSVIRTKHGDVRNIKLIAFHLVEQTDLSVHVESTIPEHLKTLKLKLCRDDSPDSPVYSVKLDSVAGGSKHWGSPSAQERFLKAGLLVQLPFIPRDKTPYFIQLESTLNKHTYAYKEPLVHFVADRTYRNFKITFEPVLKMMDHELSQSNYVIVPLLIFAALAYTYFNKALPGLPAVHNFFGSFAQNSFSFSKEERNVYGTSGPNDGASIEPVGPSIKRKPKPRKT